MSKNLSPVVPAKRLPQALLGAAALILIAGGGILFMMNAQIGTLQHIADSKEAQVGSSEQVAKRYQVTLDSYHETLGQIQYLEASVSSKTYVPTLLKQLQVLAESTHLTVTAVRPTPIVAPVVKPASGSDSGSAKSDAKPQKPLPYDTLDIAVDVTGTYADTAAFLYGLTRFPKIVSVTSAQFHPGKPDAGQNPLSSPPITTNLHLTAFVFHDDASATQAIPTLSSAPAPGGIVPPQAAGTVAGAAGRASRGAVEATHAAKAHAAAGANTL